MTDEEGMFILNDRISKLQSIVEGFSSLGEFERTTYISHSGGKDSCVLSAIVDMALPKNNLKRIYNNTGIDYPQAVKFVRKLAKNDSRFLIIPPKKNVKKTLDQVGYPFKSKQHSHNLLIYKNNWQKCEYYKKKLLTTKKDLLDRVQKGQATHGDCKYIDGLPIGVKTFIKYYFGLRVKTIKYKVKKQTHDSVVERVSVHLSRLSLSV